MYTPTTRNLQLIHRSGADRLIAASRTVIALTVLCTISLETSQPIRDHLITYAALGTYIVYTLALTLLARHMPMLLHSMETIPYAIDLAAFSCLTFSMATPSGVFFLPYAFLVVCGMLRWHWQGILATALAALIVFAGTEVYRTTILPDPAFDLDRFLIGATSFAVVALLLGYIEAYRKRVHDTLSKLVAQPHGVVHEPRVAVRNTLARAADILQAPRVLMIWEELEEPWIYLALWSHGEFHWSRESPTTFGDIVSEPFMNASFLCMNMDMPAPKVFYMSPTGIRQRQGMPLHPNLQKQFAIDTVLSSTLHGAIFEGRLFVLDRHGLTPDDLVLSDFLARQVAADLDQVYVVQRRQQAVTTAERLRLVRNLHDGLLQSLTGAALQLVETRRLLEVDPTAARQCVLEVERLLADEQRDLRALVSELKSTPYDAVEADLGLATRLEAVGKRIQCQWGLRVELDMRLAESLVPTTLAYEIYYIVHEALVNAARHAHASAARVELGMQNNHVRISVTDDGQGFPFHGHYSLAVLTYLKLGPMMLRERIASLGGSLTLDSSATGAHLDILLPLELPAWHGG
jgi:signal transduction histidine kinase